MIELVVLSTIGAAYLGSIEFRMRGMDSRLREGITAIEAERLIDHKLESVKVLQHEMKEDLQRIEHKLDILIQAR